MREKTQNAWNLFQTSLIFLEENEDIWFFLPNKLSEVMMDTWEMYPIFEHGQKTFSANWNGEWDIINKELWVGIGNYIWIEYVEVIPLVLQKTRERFNNVYKDNIVCVQLFYSVMEFCNLFLSSTPAYL